MMHQPSTVFQLYCMYGPQQGVLVPDMGGLVPNTGGYILDTAFIFICNFSVPRSGELFPVNVSLATNYTFEGKDPWFTRKTMIAGWRPL